MRLWKICMDLQQVIASKQTISSCCADMCFCCKTWQLPSDGIREHGPIPCLGYYCRRGTPFLDWMISCPSCLPLQGDKTIAFIFLAQTVFACEYRVFFLPSIRLTVSGGKCFFCQGIFVCTTPPLQYLGAIFGEIRWVPTVPPKPSNPGFLYHDGVLPTKV